MERSKKRIAQLEADRAKEEELLLDAENRVRQLEAEQSDLSATGQARCTSCSSRWLSCKASWVNRLREVVDQRKHKIHRRFAIE